MAIEATCFATGTSESTDSHTVDESTIDAKEHTEVSAIA